MIKRFSLIYGGMAGLASIGLARISRQGLIQDDDDLPTIDVVVAARNEERNMPSLIAALSSQNYPSEKVKFWLVDDDSEDNTLKIAQHAMKKDNRFIAISSNIESTITAPKKRALDTAIRQSKSEWIVTTDADCIPKPGWLRGLASFMDEEIGIVLGYSPLFGASRPLEFLAEGESWSSAALCAAAVGLGYPFNAFGRNFSFRRKIYLDMDGYSHDGDIASGDDDLFLQRVASRTDWKVRFSADHRTFVPSVVPPADRFIKTKSRHMSVGPRYAPGWVVIGALGSIAFMGLGLATIASIFGFGSRSKVWTAWKIKWFFDLLMATSTTRILGDVRRGALSLLTMSVAPFAFWIIWPKALFGNVDWKGRTFEKGRSDKNVTESSSGN